MSQIGPANGQTVCTDNGVQQNAPNAWRDALHDTTAEIAIMAVNSLDILSSKGPLRWLTHKCCEPKALCSRDASDHRIFSQRDPFAIACGQHHETMHAPSSLSIPS